MINDYIFNMFVIVRSFGKLMAREFAKAGYNYMPQHFTTIVLIKHFQPLNLSKIAENTFKSKATITRTIDRLIKDGIVQKSENIEDRRERTLIITDKGEKTYKNLLNIYLKLEKEALIGVPQKRQDECINYFGIILKNIGY